ncbi:MAG: SDR family NAD(P)-dependent oxidoreductase [Chloroflexaceae bacterium]|nr:SDR family NAD(P)-dependent oxidoreductase [Chloroflexaceae bacterium]
MPVTLPLEGKIALITGATGGLGGAVVAALHNDGATIAVPHQHAGELDTLRERQGLPADARLHGAVVNLLDAAAVETFCNDVATTHGGINILINIAGGFAGGKPVHATDWDVWQGQLDLNLKTAVLTSRYAVPHMIARGSGAIINIGSRAAVQPSKNLAAYAASKRAVLYLTETMAAELLEQNITVNAVLPSTIDTPGNRAAMPNGNFDTWVKPAEIAAVIRFLVGADARIISGATIPVYGQS